MAIDLDRCTGCQACVVGLLRREQRPGGRAASRTATAASMALDPDRALLRDRDGRAPRGLVPADALPAVRRRALRAGLPGLRDLPHRRGAQRAGLQPLRRHALLRQQLPLQGARLQLVRLHEVARSRSTCSSTRTSPCAAKGVMEKCTFCVQRIRLARERRPATRGAPVRDGEVAAGLRRRPARRRPSSSATCNDPELARSHAGPTDPRGYRVLEELEHPARRHLPRARRGRRPNMSERAPRPRRRHAPRRCATLSAGPGRATTAAARAWRPSSPCSAAGRWSVHDPRRAWASPALEPPGRLGRLHHQLRLLGRHRATPAR